MNVTLGSHQNLRGSALLTLVILAMGFLADLARVAQPSAVNDYLTSSARTSGFCSHPF